MHSYTLNEARTIVMDCVKKYTNNLIGKKYIIIYRDKLDGEIKYIEVEFKKENYQHLTGIELIDENGNVRKNVASLFYAKCLNNRLGKNEIRFKRDGTTNLKLAALPIITQIQRVTKIAGSYNNCRPYLVADKVVGNVNCCVGLKKVGNEYVPVSALLENIKTLTTYQSQVLAILSKPSKQEIYNQICHVSKGLNLFNLEFPQDILNKISLDSYIPKVKIINKKEDK